MIILALGMATIVTVIFTVMGTPYAYYSKRDNKWEKSDKQNLDVWYE